MRNRDKRINSFLGVGFSLALIIISISVVTIGLAWVNFESAPIEIVDLDQEDLLTYNNTSPDVHQLILLPNPTANLFKKANPTFDETDSESSLVLRC
ncbi:MAG: hypothetical protein A2V86_04745 [Deltaproteobacteria bacterium RBG_16_49_23]|nr:MAG: hypothetical protein A2V86_04745 [Deltaproteobacteria bacterium RBG_16_49_23]